jgi:drug/metabolite transporter (DMT)-like permease
MTPSIQTENRTMGILWMLATMFCFLALDAVMKLALEHYPLVQVTWGRFFFASLAAVAVCGRRLPVLARSKVPAVQILRSLLLMITTALFNAGIMQAPLATATTIMYLTPILVTLLSIFLLREEVGVRRWIGILVGFVGALVVVQPWSLGSLGSAGFGSLVQSGTMFFLLAAISNACYQIATRWVRGDDPLTSLLFTAAMGAIISSAVLPYYWVWPDLWGWTLLIVSGAAGALGHLCIIRAFQSAPASVVAPYSYSSLLWAVIFGFLIWGDWPTANVWVGAALMVAAGLYIFIRERTLAGRGRATQLSAADKADIGAA